MTQKSHETVKNYKTHKEYPEGMFWYRKDNLGAKKYLVVLLI